MKKIAAVILFFVATCAAKPVIDKNGKEWPECVPPEPSDISGYSINNVPYYCSDEGRWEIDKESVKRLHEEEGKQSDLLHALGTRKLSHSELLSLTPSINVFPNQPYFACEKYAELYDLLLTQWELQTGVPLPVKTPLSRRLGEYNRCPQEWDNKIAVETLIEKLKALK